MDGPSASAHAPAAGVVPKSGVGTGVIVPSASACSSAAGVAKNAGVDDLSPALVSHGAPHREQQRSVFGSPGLKRCDLTVLEDELVMAGIDNTPPQTFFPRKLSDPE